MLFKTANLPQLAEFDAIIDVRTPAEFAEDHIPGAINCPVFSNEERIIVGTLYKQASPFEARKVGAAMVARNIAHHLETRFRDYPKSWKPLIYCWRGGQRSGAMSIIFAQVGWSAHKLEGGYKTYRRDVLEKLDTMPAAFDYRVICGATGSGKSRLLAALAEQGAQVLDLEGLAQHRGSILGGLPQQPQPSQKSFESGLIQTLRSFAVTRPVYVEAESNKIGRITLPAALHNAMHGSPCIMLDTTPAARLALLMEDYRHLINAPEKLGTLLQVLLPFQGKQRITHWLELIHEKSFATLVEELLELHYDPSYLRALGKHYTRLDDAQHLALSDLSHDALCGIAKTLPT